GPSFRITIPKFPTKDPNHRILARQKSRFTHDYFYIRDEVMGPMVMRVATFFPFQTTYYLNGHTFTNQLVMVWNFSRTASRWSKLLLRPKSLRLLEQSSLRRNVENFWYCLRTACLK